MKRIVLLTLGWAARIFGILLALITLLFLFTGEFRGATMFAPLSFALIVAGSNLIAYGKRQHVSETNKLPKE